MANILTTVVTDVFDSWEIEEREYNTVASGENAFVIGQALAFDYTTIDGYLQKPKLKKYASGGSNGINIVKRIAMESGDATSADVKVLCMKAGKLPRTEIIGVDVVVPTYVMTTPVTPTGVKGTGVGSLTAAVHTYKYIATNDLGITVPSATVSVTTETTNLQVTVSITAVSGATGYKMWRTIDGGTTWKYKVLTAAEITALAVVDNGTLSWTTATPVTATDVKAIAIMEDSKLEITDEANQYRWIAGGGQ